MLHIHDLTYGYGQTPVLDQLRLEERAGQMHGILGPNGAGKTTLFRLVAGWLKPKAGTLTWNGKPPQKRQVAFLETEPYFYPYLKGVEYLRLIRDDKARIGQWNQLFELPIDDLIDTYSTGMRKKLAFLGVLLQERPVLILDEPFNGVDLAGNEVMMAVLCRREIRQGVTLVSSHILSTLTQVCDRISMLGQGRILQTFERENFVTLEARVRAETGEQLDKIMENWQ